LNTVVSVPDSCWKIIVILDSGQRVKDITSQTRVIAVMMKNGTYTSGTTDWKLYATTVDAIEQSTGYDFLSDVPKPIQAIIESKSYVSVREYEHKRGLEIYPNPSQDHVTIIFECMPYQTYSIDIHDILGHSVKSFQSQSALNAEGSSTFDIDIEDIPIGAYSIVIRSQYELFATQFMKH